MEGVGARLGRSSSRYGPTTVFTGPVRKWKKKWVPIAPSNSNHQNAAATATVAGNRTVNGSNVPPHLLLYQWTPITPSQNKDNGIIANNNGNADSKNSNKDDVVAVEEPPKKKFKYIPIIVLEEQKNESSEQAEDETKPFETDTVEVTSKSDEYNEKPDINDMPLDENQALHNTSLERQDLNESTLDLSLG
ncbi:uncharacterized protein [Primulina eburnea]|uniref:uncharacterized protein n=1 Tax=Primulina eburnea TaxID=1245227 RepID=UPI003C6C299D